jgi:FecR protein
MSRLMRWNATAWLLCAATVPLCQAQFLYTESDQYAATALSLSGSVSVLRDNQPWALNVGDRVHVQQIIVSGADGHALFRVSDGSTFEVFPNSRVIFRKNPPTWGDLIDIIMGRVRVHIEHLFGDQPNPNRIYTPTAVISVRGTTFDVSVDGDDETTVIEVEEGVVDVRHALIGGATKKVSAGETLTVYRTEPIASASAIDRHAIIRFVVRAVEDAITTDVYRTHSPIPTGGGSTTVGDGGKPTPPPNTPPPPPPGGGN